MALFNQEQIEFINKNVDGIRNKELAQLINDRFSLSITPTQICQWKQTHGVKSRTSLYGWRKGKIGGKDFKMPSEPSHGMPVGTERVNKRGITQIKIARGKWIDKHRQLWEQANGPIPENHIVVFMNNDKTDFRLENLKCISRRELSYMNKQQYEVYDAESKESAILLSKIGLKGSELSREINDR
ncbi:HNH endonuclease signature motif containing protein [Enterococcus devriesei]|uniref:HNH endonuclease signature motif containing protein n=1 Tax=Enterococcus devriesei TaxID=319970 RepID=UPI0035EC52F1